MKRVFYIVSILCVATFMPLLSSAKGDWRQGIWNRNVSENLFSINVEAIPVITDAFKNTTPWAAGFNLGYEHKMRPSIIHGKVSFGYGGHIGLSRYFGKSITTTVIGHELHQRWDKYKSYSEIPILLDFNMFLNLKRSNIFLGVSAGVNLMLGERDASLNQIGPSATKDLEEMYAFSYGKDIDVVSIQLNENNVSLTRVIPTFRVQLGYTYELSQDWALRIKAGLDYQMQYDDEYKGFHLDADYYDFYHSHESPQMLNPFFSVGLVYSL